MLKQTIASSVSQGLGGAPEKTFCRQRQSPTKGSAGEMKKREGGGGGVVLLLLFIIINYYVIIIYYFF